MKISLIEHGTYCEGGYVDYIYLNRQSAEQKYLEIVVAEGWTITPKDYWEAEKSCEWLHLTDYEIIE